MKNPFVGLGVALITPFKSDLSIDYNTLGQLLDAQLSGGMDFLCLLGTTAETPCLTDAEKREVIRFVVDRVAGRVPILLGLGGNCTAKLLHEVEQIEPMGVDGILSVCPYYNRPNQRGLVAHFSALAEHTNLPIVLYNIPARTGMNMEPDTMVRLAEKYPNIVAVKEASGNLEQTAEILRIKPADFDVISGDDALTLQLMQMGAVGVISVLANALPDAVARMIHAQMAGKVEEAQQEERRFDALYPLLFKEGNPAGVKALLGCMGKVENVLRLPLVPVSGETEMQIRQWWNSAEK